MNIPKDKSYPKDSVQCDNCGGNGCNTCDQKGWHVPSSHPKGRHCAREGCDNPLHPTQIAVYCSDDCAFLDAG